MTNEQIPLAWPAEVLLPRLSRLLAARQDNLSLVVRRLDYLQDGARYILQLIVHAHSDKIDRVEEWQVDLPFDHEEMTRLTDLDTFVLIVRSWIEEWWDLHSTRDHVAAYGTDLE
jgi:hypothetical protein